MKKYGKGISVLAMAMILSLPGLGWGSVADDLAQGREALAQGSYSRAIELLERAIGSSQLDRADLAGAHFDRGRAYEAKGYHANALSAYQWALHYDLSNREYLHSLRRMRRVFKADR